MLYLAVGENIICFNLNSNTIILNKEQQFVVIGSVCNKEKSMYVQFAIAKGKNMENGIQLMTIVQSKIEIICSDGKYIFSLMMATAILPEYRLRQAMRYCVSTIRATTFWQRHIRKKAAAYSTVSLSLMTLTAT